MNWVETDVPLDETCRLGRLGGAGMPLGWPPSKLRVKIAFSPTVTFSRSSVAVKVAALRDQLEKIGTIIKSKRARKPLAARLPRIGLVWDNGLSIYFLTVCPSGQDAQASLGARLYR